VAQLPTDLMGSTFTPLSPVRVLDTRTSGGPVGPASAVTLDLAGRLPGNATAVVLNVTGTNPTASTFITVSPSDRIRPTVSNLNLVAGQTRPNLVTVAVGVDRKLDLYNNAGTVHLIADLAGYYSTAPGSRYTPVPPIRALDTRYGSGLVGPGRSVSVRMTGWSGIPASATAVALNITATSATAPTFVTAWPQGQARPNVSNINVLPGETVPNMATVGIGTDRSVDLYNNAGSVHLLVDVAGYYTPEFGALFTPVPPQRILDTRDGTGTWRGLPGKIGPNLNVSWPVRSPIPHVAMVPVLNLTGTNATQDTYVTAWDYSNSYPPGTSNLNLSAGQTAANLAIPPAVADGGAPHDPTRRSYIYNHAGSIDVIADLNGYFALPAGDCQSGCVHVWGYRSVAHPGSPWTSVPRLMSGLDQVSAVAGTNEDGYALRADGTVRAWGLGTTGRLGNGTSWGRVSAPVPVTGLTAVKAIAAGSYSNGYALRTDGTVWAWGDSQHGQLGSDRSSNVPVKLPGLSSVTAIAAAGATGYALRSDGTVWAWGSNNVGQLGNGSAGGSSAVPAQVPGLTGVTAIASGGGAAYAVKSDATVWAWGSNSRGQLGNPAPIGSNKPLQVSALSGVTAIAGSWENGYALRADGTVWAWGSNDDGQLGNGVDCNQCGSNLAVQVTGLTNAKALGAGLRTGYAVREDGTSWAWGANSNGELGNSSGGAYSTVPVQVSVSGASAVAGGLALVP
jgi:alpha-tubulin suppressor-like RCC1 family protein